MEQVPIDVHCLRLRQVSLWKRWGRVGEVGQSQVVGPFGELAAATAAFKKYFKEKTKNNWAERGNFEDRGK